MAPKSKPKAKAKPKVAPKKAAPKAASKASKKPAPKKPVPKAKSSAKTAKSSKAPRADEDEGLSGDAFARDFAANLGDDLLDPELEALLAEDFSDLDDEEEATPPSRLGKAAAVPKPSKPQLPSEDDLLADDDDEADLVVGKVNEDDYDREYEDEEEADVIEIDGYRSKSGRAAPSRKAVHRDDDDESYELGDDDDDLGDDDDDESDDVDAEGEDEEGGIQEQTVTCPYCFEDISISVDSSVPNQTYVEDCSVCCRPIQFEVEAENGHVRSVNVERNE